MLGRILIGLIRVYQVGVSPWTPANCRFIPTCSAYAAEAIRTQGAGRGILLAIRRIGRCHPWGGHGYDPVPQSRTPEVGQPPANEPDEMARADRMTIA